MARFLGLKKVPIFDEAGDAKITTEYGKCIKDYPTTGKTGDHWGLDIVRSSDGKKSDLATIIAPASGTVTRMRVSVKGFDDKKTQGNCVYVKTASGYEYAVFHLKYGTLPAGMADGYKVKKGEVLGYMGNTGYSYGAHVHWQVNDPKGNPVNPEPWLTGKKSFDDVEKYAVEIGPFDKKETAETLQSALKTLGTASNVKTI